MSEPIVSEVKKKKCRPKEPPVIEEEQKVRTTVTPEDPDSPTGSSIAAGTDNATPYVIPKAAPGQVNIVAFTDICNYGAVLRWGLMRFFRGLFRIWVG